MNECLATLDQSSSWADDLEIEELSSIRSATTIIVIVIPSPVPMPVNGLTTLR